MKIVIIGCPSSGKTTLANKISKKLNLSVFHLDKIFWVEPKGIKQDVFIAKQKEYINNNDSWIIDGSFINSKSFDLRIENSDLIIVYDFPKYLIYWRLIKRFFRDYDRSRSDMPNERKETLKTTYHLAKYIWVYDNEKIWKKIVELVSNKRILKIKTLKEEKEIMNKL